MGEVMRDPRDEDLKLEDVALEYFGHTRATMLNKVAAKEYPFPVYRLGGSKSPWFVRASDFKKYRDQVHKDSSKNHAA